MMNFDLCRDFQIVPDEGGYRVITPWRYTDRDKVVVWVQPKENGRFLIDDNGEALFRLALDGGDAESSKVRTWLASAPAMLGTRWNGDTNQLETECKESELPAAIHAVAETSAILACLFLTRESRLTATFKDEVLAVLRDIGRETGIEAKMDVPLDERRLFLADCLFLAPTPLAVIIATSTERLLEAELAWSEARRLGEATHIIAVAEGEGSAISRRRMDQAQYFTDKTFAFRGFEPMFHKALAERLTH